VPAELVLEAAAVSARVKRNLVEVVRDLVEL
jgi:hypothetical protein